MFPGDDGETGMPAKEDQTVMRQAAELLEDALREAGGSMAEIGTNPLFSGSGAAEGPAQAEPKPKSPVTPASEWTTADTPKALAATVAALRAEEAAAHKPAEKRRSDAPRMRETPTSIRPASAVSAGKKKGSSGSLIFLGTAAAFAVAAGVMFRDQLFGAGAAPEPAAVPASPPSAPVPVAPTMASVTTVTIPPAQSATASAASEKQAVAAPPPSASAAASAAASAEASTAPPPRAPTPAPVVKHPPAPPVATGASETTTAPPAKSAAPASPAPLPTKPAPPPKAKPEKPTDDNPY
jgi:hypothetical protein